MDKPEKMLFRNNQTWKERLQTELGEPAEADDPSAGDDPKEADQLT